MAPKVAPKAAAAAKAKAKAAPKLRPRNGVAVQRGLVGKTLKPLWLRQFEVLYKHNLLDTSSTQTICLRKAKAIAEWLLTQSAAEQGRIMQMLAVFRNQTLRRILRAYHEQRQRSQWAVNQALCSTNLAPGTMNVAHFGRPMVVTPNGVIM